MSVYLHTDTDTDKQTHTHTHFRKLAQFLPALPPVNNQQRLCSCMLTRASTAAVPTCVASRRPPALDVYLPTYSVEQAQCLPALPPEDKPPRLCACTHTRAKLLTPADAAPVYTALDMYRHELASSQALPALKVAIDDECLGKGLAFTKYNPPDFGLLSLAQFVRFPIPTETEVTVHTH